MRRRRRGSRRRAGALLTGLVGYWALEEASGDRADSHTGGLTLTDNNTVTQAAAGLVDEAAQFTAANSETLSRADSAALSTGPGVAFTLALWVYLDSAGADRPCMTKWGGAFGSREFWLGYDNSDGSFSLQVSDGSAGTGVVSSLGAPSTATWYFVVGRYHPDTDEISISVDAGTPDTESFTGSVPDSTAAFVLGSDALGGSGHHNGRMDEVMYWKGRVLTEVEVAWLYNSGSGRTYAAVAAYAG